MAVLVVGSLERGYSKLGGPREAEHVGRGWPGEGGGWALGMRGASLVERPADAA